MKRILIVAALLAAGAVVAWRVFAGSDGDQPSYRFVSVERGDLESSVSSTGSLDAVTTVEVGTQVSGILSEITVDFNDRVREGQVIARIGTTLLASAVRAAEASLERAEAQLAQAEADYERMERLFKDQVVTEVERNTTRYQRDINRAAVKAARIDLERARKNLAYTTITAPISGTIVERTVDVGQTVAASLSAPKLFLIAGDLTKLQILAAVDESDIGQIKQGQAARFTVQAYPDKVFEGHVRQVRLQSTMQENVVSYTVVVDVDNSSGVLLPGMTATVDFIIESRQDVFKVANAALRFRASDEMWAELRSRREKEGGPGLGAGATGNQREGGGDRAGGGARDAGTARAGADMRAGHGAQAAQGQPGGNRSEGDRTLLWYLDESGRLNARPVRAGITDGQSTEISGEGLSDGLQVIAGTNGGTAATSASPNPFQGGQQSRPGGPPRMGF